MLLIVVGTLMIGRGVLWLVNPHPDFGQDIQTTYGWTFIALGTLALALGVKRVLTKAAQTERASTSHSATPMPVEPESTRVTTSLPKTSGHSSAVRRIAEGVLIGVLATGLTTLLGRLIGD